MVVQSRMVKTIAIRKTKEYVIVRWWRWWRW